MTLPICHNQNSKIQKEIAGNITSAIAFKIKTTTNENEIWAFFGFNTDEIAAIALPPHIAVPAEMRVPVLASTRSSFVNKNPTNITETTEIAVSKNPVFDALTIWVKFIPNPINTIEACNENDVYFVILLCFNPSIEKSKPITNATAGEINGNMHNKIIVPLIKLICF
jgi:hypothetical protein